MRKFKVTVAVLLTVAVLIGGAYIPCLVARFLDWQTTGKSSLNSIASVKLNIYQALSSADKLAMMSKLESLLPIKESKAGMTREELMNIVHEELSPYIDAQLAVLHEDHVQTQPYLAQVPDIPEMQRVIWQVTISGNDADFTFWDLLIDDETGKILRISYTAENPPGIIVGMEALQLFADIYFSGLGIEDYWDYAAPDLEYAGDNGNAIRFLFTDTRYGQITVDLNVHDHGFYVEFPIV